MLGKMMVMMLVETTKGKANASFVPLFSTTTKKSKSIERKMGCLEERFRFYSSYLDIIHLIAVHSCQSSCFLLPAVLWHLLNNELQVLIPLSAAPFFTTTSEYFKYSVMAELCTRAVMFFSGN